MTNETDFATLGDTLRLLRRFKLLTQVQLAEKCGVDQSTIARWEKTTAVPALRHRKALAEALEMPVSIIDEKAQAAA